MMIKLPQLVPDGVGPPYTSSYGYNVDEQKLYQFTRNWKLIEYEGVTPEEYSELCASDKKFQYMKEEIIPFRKYRMVRMQEIEGPIDDNGIYV
jgi:hypothetical protein